MLEATPDRVAGGPLGGLHAAAGDVGRVGHVDAGGTHGGVDIVFSDHYRRVLPSDTPAEVIGGYVDTNSLGTQQRCGPSPRSCGRADGLLVVASSLGTLAELQAQLHARFDRATEGDDIDAVMTAWRDAVIAGRAGPEGWRDFINIPSKVGQVAAVRVLARERVERDQPSGPLIAAVCPGMVDTGASRPWFDMPNAQTPTDAAQPLLDLALDRSPPLAFTAS